MKKASAISLLKKLCLAFLGLILHFSSGAQCNNNLLQRVSYDTLIAGSGNDSYTFSFSKFNPSLGTLVAVKINSLVSVNYGFVLKNVESVKRNFSISVGRIDYFQSDALADVYNNQMQVNIGTFPLNPGNSVSQSLTPIISHYLNTDSVTSNLSNFMGAGTVSFDYEPTTYTTLLGSANYYYSASAADTVHFSITYLYCNAGVLLLNMGNFQALKENNTTIQLSWTTENELAGRNYEIQKSADGNNFAPVVSIPSVPDSDGKGSYLHNYTIGTDDKARIYFRVKETDGQGLVKYSEIRSVDLDDNDAAGMRIFPNPATSFVNVAFNQPSVKNWQVDIFSANGILIQSNSCLNTSTAHISFKEKPASGIYFIRATDQQTHKSFVQNFLIE